MAASGKAASKKGELSAYNLGDEGFYEDDGAGDYDYDAELARFERTATDPQKKGPRKPSRKELELERSEAAAKQQQLGLVHMSAEGVAALSAAEEARLKERKRANKIREIAEAEEAERLEAEREARAAARRYKRSSAYKRECWEKKLAEREAFEADRDAKEAAHSQKVEEWTAVSARAQRQRRIDLSWEKKEEKKPAPKPGGKKGKAVDLSRYAGMMPTQPNRAAVPAERKLPWDAAAGDKDPHRPGRAAEWAQFEKEEKAWKKYLLEWGK
eukprot:TRINITY_DN5578_c0_g1_i2.p1 TRINITY_DN5578_c0_g1~~TRINITY_DN5578_c0_g1_i2.p1  ORF type:complete len:287 (+),score=137.28 TRINITY_DN5578_c0_g1_i2:51-863(+)